MRLASLLVLSLAPAGLPPSASTAEAGFISNAGFEAVPDGATGQGRLPTGWVAVTLTPDTYGNDGSYGLQPEAFGNFPGVAASEGIRWVAGGAFGRTAASTTVGGESLGTSLVSTLAPGAVHEFSADLFQAKRSDLDNMGGYHVFLATGNTPAGISGAVLLGALWPTTGVDSWESRSLSFVAPLDSASRPFLILAPYALAGNAYPGIDRVSLVAESTNAVPEPSSTALTAVVLLVLIATSAVRRGRRGCTVFTRASAQQSDRAV